MSDDDRFDRIEKRIESLAGIVDARFNRIEMNLETVRSGVQELHADVTSPGTSVPAPATLRERAGQVALPAGLATALSTIILVVAEYLRPAPVAMPAPQAQPPSIPIAAPAPTVGVP